MARKAFSFLTFLLIFAPVWGQSAREKVMGNQQYARGIYYMQMEPLSSGTPAPKGYKPVYISHYARHGARYLVSDKYYSSVLDPLREASLKGCLTPLGKRLLEAGSAFYENAARGRAGDLSPVGWRQHQDIARQMVSAFPPLFRGRPHIEASASTSVRSIISMNAFDLALQQVLPRAEIYEQAGKCTLPWTLPEKKENAADFHRTDMPWSISPKEYLASQIDCGQIVARLFTSPEYVSDPVQFCIYLYNFLVSDICTESRIGIDQEEMFSLDEIFALWEEDNLETYDRVAGSLTCYLSMLEDIVSRAESDLASGISARLRFGHDIGIDALAFMLGIDGADRRPSAPAEVADIWQNWRTPMASTFLLVLYTSKRGEPLFKVILNGEEVSVAKFSPVTGPYYRWRDLEGIIQICSYE